MLVVGMEWDMHRNGYVADVGGPYSHVRGDCNILHSLDTLVYRSVKALGPHITPGKRWLFCR
jgi:hypothetical protein